jgi:SAM-dependent methyltransferase
MPAGGTYSATWFETFMETIEASQSDREVRFILEQLGEARRVLDVPCGLGRHARRLHGAGRRVVGIDRDEAVLARARASEPEVAWIQADMSALPIATEAFDAVICMWQSFGHLDDGANAGVLRRLRGTLRPGGVLVSRAASSIRGSR